MLRAFLRFLSAGINQSSQADRRDRSANPMVVLYAQPAAERRPTPAQLPGSERVNHRVRLLAMRLEHTQLCSPARCRRLGELGVITAGDLASCDLVSIARQLSSSKKAIRVLKTYRRAIRLAAAVPGMMPRDAQLLISIHRRSVRGLAAESPATLRRDLERFAESTPGRRQLRGRRLPSAKRVKRWIAVCQDYARCTPTHVAAG